MNNPTNSHSIQETSGVGSPLVSIIMGSTSDLPVMEKACQLLDQLQIPFEVNALSAHRTPDAVEQFAHEAQSRGLRVIIAAAGMAAALPGVIAASTTLPVIGVPIKGMLDGLDALLSIVQMPPGIPVATVGVNGAQNAAILAVEMLALSDEAIAQRLAETVGITAEKPQQHAESLHIEGDILQRTGLVLSWTMESAFLFWILSIRVHILGLIL